MAGTSLSKALVQVFNPISMGHETFSELGSDLDHVALLVLLAKAGTYLANSVVMRLNSSRACPSSFRRVH